MYYGSFLGIVLAMVAIAAWTVFLYQLSNAQSESNPADETGESY